MRFRARRASSGAARMVARALAGVLREHTPAVADALLTGTALRNRGKLRAGRNAVPPEFRSSRSSLRRIRLPRSSRYQLLALPRPMNVPPEIFKAYDIRGVVGKALTAPVVHAIGQALGSLALERGRDTLVVGRDGRLSGPELAGALADGIRASGANVIDIGMVTTPMSYFAAQHLDTQCSVMVTGSHNPPDYNGLKMVIAGDHARRRGHPGAARRASRTGRCAAARALTARPISARPTSTASPATSSWRARCASRSTAATASRAPTRPRCSAALGCTVTELFCEVDGTFPQPSSGSVAAEESAGPDALPRHHRQRARHRLRRRRRPARRGHQGWRHHLRRSPADAVRRRHAEPQSRRHGHLRRQVDAQPQAVDHRSTAASRCCGKRGIR